ncbi:peptidase inhibitor family I36 protein [Streptomyces sp. NPDC047525]|uniref:peptidase inhibitor family I36 protein n=1 Tax=Streptomyces sp. NPDC047525 TaxID=3155264 RepID=UPI0033C7C9B4
MKLRTLLASTSVAVLSGTLFIAPSASADSTVPRFGTAQDPCPLGHVCYYSGYNQSGDWCGSSGDRPDSICGLRYSYFNNGRQQTDYDHVYVSFKEGGKKCLHYGPDEGKGNLNGGKTIKSYYWGPECP